MSALRAFAAAVPFVIIAAACGPEPVGVDACRKIEDARCEVASACGIQTDVDDCKRFYRDQCLHGFALKEAPQSADVTRCVDAIRAAGACAQNDASMAIADCVADPPLAATPGATLANVCDIVRTPENASACSFLQPNAPDAGADSGSASTGGSGGTAGAGGGSGGTAGAGG
jgi:hypothetical protein